MSELVRRRKKQKGDDVFVEMGFDYMYFGEGCFYVLRKVIAWRYKVDLMVKEKKKKKRS